MFISKHLTIYIKSLFNPFRVVSAIFFSYFLVSKAYKPKHYKSFLLMFSFIALIYEPAVNCRRPVPSLVKDVKFDIMTCHAGP